jgi:hypothetical protein
MKRRLTAQPGRGLPTRSRPDCGRPPTPGRRPELAMAVKAQVTAARTMPTSRWPGRGAGDRESRPSARGGRAPSRPTPAIVRCRARYRIPPEPGRGHQLGHGTRTSGGRGRRRVRVLGLHLRLGGLRQGRGGVNRDCRDLAPGTGPRQASASGGRDGFDACRPCAYVRCNVDAVPFVLRRSAVPAGRMAGWTSRSTQPAS